MKIVSIFGETKRTLLAVQYDGQEEDEFNKAFNQWHDVTYLRNFFHEHKPDLQYGFYEWPDINSAIEHTQKLANALEDLILEKADENAEEIPEMLQSIFKPLNNNELTTQDLQRSKTSKKWLRLYAIRLGTQCYIITGSAIKLVKNMDERSHLRDELQNLERVKNHLKEKGITDENDIDFFEINN